MWTQSRISVNACWLIDWNKGILKPEKDGPPKEGGLTLKKLVFRFKSFMFGPIWQTRLCWLVYKTDKCEGLIPTQVLNEVRVGAFPPPL